MSQQSRQFDFWYAVHNTKIVRGPTRALETFGATRINYHHLAELPDDPRKIRIREGRMEAHKPAIITPEEYAEAQMDGFGDEARRYLEFLKENRDNIRILQYGYQLRQEAFSEQVVTDSLEAVTGRVVKEVEDAKDDFAAFGATKTTAAAMNEIAKLFDGITGVTVNTLMKYGVAVTANYGDASINALAKVAFK